MSDEVLRLNRFLELHPTLKYSLLGTGPSYFIATESLKFQSKLIKSLRQEFPGYEIYNCSNTNNHKVIIKHLLRY